MRSLVLCSTLLAAHLGSAHVQGGYVGPWAKHRKAPVLTGEAKRRDDALIGYAFVTKLPPWALAQNRENARRRKAQALAQAEHAARMQARYPAGSFEAKMWADQRASALETAKTAHLPRSSPFHPGKSTIPMSRDKCLALIKESERVMAQYRAGHPTAKFYAGVKAEALRQLAQHDTKDRGQPSPHRGTGPKPLRRR